MDEYKAMIADEAAGKETQDRPGDVLKSLNETVESIQTTIDNLYHRTVLPPEPKGITKKFLEDRLLSAQREQEKQTEHLAAINDVFLRTFGSMLARQNRQEVLLTKILDAITALDTFKEKPRKVSRKPLTIEQLRGLTLKDLRLYARALGMIQHARLCKQDLVVAIYRFQKRKGKQK